MIIVDTNLVSELLRPAPEPRIEAWFAARKTVDTYMTTISEAELRYGVAVMPEGKRRDVLIRRVEKLLTKIFRGRVLSFDSPAAEVYAVIAAGRRKAGRPIGPLDGQIAAIARVRGAAVATRNVRDFEGCGVEIINPWNQG